MKCSVCGGVLTPGTTDLPFKTKEQTIVIVRSLPVLQCSNCPEYQLEDAVFARVEQLLSTASKSAELEVIRFAA